MDVALQDYQNFTQEISRKIDMKNTKRSCQIFRDCLAMNLQSYLTRWKEYTKYQRNKMNQSFVDGNFRLYRSLLLHSFLKWKRQAAKKRTWMMRMQISNLESLSSNREKEIILYMQKWQ